VSNHKVKCSHLARCNGDVEYNLMLRVLHILHRLTSNWRSSIHKHLFWNVWFGVTRNDLKLSGVEILSNKMVDPNFFLSRSAWFKAHLAFRSALHVLIASVGSRKLWCVPLL